MNYPVWLVPLLLALGVICAAIGGMTGPPAAGAAYPRLRWFLAACVLGAVAALLIVVAALAGP